MGEQRLARLMQYLPSQVQRALGRMAPDRQAQLQELRLRAARPVAVAVGMQEWFLTDQGTLTDLAPQGIVLTQPMLQQTFQAVCAYSVYRYGREIPSGFVTIAGGCRVGIAGTAVYRDGALAHIRDISGLNFRIPQAAVGCARMLYQRTWALGPRSLLILGAVGAGKTTMLRDLCRMVGDRHRVSLVDERGEIAAALEGVPQYDVGLHTDVLDGFPRAQGLMTALRVLTPEVLICDEIGTQADADAIVRIHGCGVPVIASAHGTSWSDLCHRQTLGPLLAAGVFQDGVLLDLACPGRIQEIRSLDRP